jgi:hypothetical protein
VTSGPIEGADVLVASFTTPLDAELARTLLDAAERRQATDTADARVSRAYALALVGLMLLPLIAHAISLFNLLRVPWAALSAKGRRRYVIGVCVDLLVIVPVAYWLVTIVSREPAEDVPYLFERAPGEPFPAR